MAIACVYTYVRALDTWATSNHVVVVLDRWQSALRVTRATLIASMGAALAVWVDRTGQGVHPHAGWSVVFVIPAMFLGLGSLIATWRAHRATRVWAEHHQPEESHA